MRDVNEFLILANVRTDTVLKAGWEEFDPGVKTQLGTPGWAETAPIGVARQGPLTCPLATFAVAIYKGGFTSTPVHLS